MPGDQHKPIAMIQTPLKSRLDRAKQALSQTIQKILDINRKRKGLSKPDEVPQQGESLKKELRLLNKMAEQQARVVQNYELKIRKTPQAR